MRAACRHERRRHAASLIVSLALLVQAPMAGAQLGRGRSAPASHAAERDARVDALFAKFGAGSPGAAVVVARGDSIIFARGYGFADIEHGVAVTPATSFRLASVSKQFTAAAILSLVESGRLALDARIGDLLSGVPSYARDVRVRHLLAHTSGLPDYEVLIGKGSGPQVHDGDVLALLHRARALHFPPGTAWRYSNSGYLVLALIVERVSGESFSDYLRHRIFDPVGMPTAVAHVEGRDTVANRAFGYSRVDGVWTRTDQNRTSATLGDGGIYASAEELVRWSAALDRGAVLSPASVRAAMTPTHLDRGGVAPYGYGWFLDTHHGHRRERHEGDSIGFRTAIQRFPDDGLTVVVLTNRAATPIDVLSDGVASIFLDP